jgi:hypothetical protein
VHALLLLLLGLGAVQLLVALAAVARGRRSHRAGTSSHARYSYSHAGLLAAGSLVLAVPLVLGLAMSSRRTLRSPDAHELPLGLRRAEREEDAHVERLERDRPLSPPDLPSRPAGCGTSRPHR